MSGCEGDETCLGEVADEVMRRPLWYRGRLDINNAKEVGHSLDREELRHVKLAIHQVGRKRCRCIRGVKVRIY